MSALNKNLLVELFVEELPPKALNTLGESLSSALFASLKAQGLTSEHSVVTAFASPRRLGVHISYVPVLAQNKEITQKLMPISVGLDANGAATPALIKRLHAMGLDEAVVSQLFKDMDGKNEALFIHITQAGAALQEGLQKAFTEAISQLPIPKVMTYQLADGWSDVNFVRPAHGLLALHGETIVPITALGLEASNQTLGHRFEASVTPVVIRHADSYADQLKTEGAVIASFVERRAEIKRQLTVAASKEHLTPIDDNDLLDEVTALVERPNVLLGQFENIYLAVPQECLILTMKANQKYFPLLDTNGKLTHKFLIVSNISPSDPSPVIDGNERVVRPRLADAKFFFDQDRKKTLESRCEGLNKVVYHNKLGSQGARTARVAAIAKAIGYALAGDHLANQAELAAKLAKADLVTDMVGEFPELQGIMGRYYAQHEGLDEDVAFAIEDHYKPRFAGDALPRNSVGICVALADKLETLVGLFSIGEKPTGDKDPFALRRHALGVIRILMANDHPFAISQLVDMVIDASQIALSQQDRTALIDFIFDRISGLMREEHFSANEIDAVISHNPETIKNISKQLQAVQHFASLPEAPALAAANKRVGNILKKAEGEVHAIVNTQLLQEPAEIALNQALSQVKPMADALFESGDYTASLQSLASLKAPVDAFFENVMVNADDAALKANRLGLLATLHQTMNRVADLSKLAS